VGGRERGEGESALGLGVDQHGKLEVLWPRRLPSGSGIQRSMVEVRINIDSTFEGCDTEKGTVTHYNYKQLFVRFEVQSHMQSTVKVICNQ